MLPPPGRLRRTGRSRHGRQDGRAGEQRRDPGEGPGVAPRQVLHGRDEERPGDARDAPRREDPAVVHPHVARPEPVRDERRHRPEAAAVAEEDDREEGGRRRQRVDAARRQEDDHLEPVDEDVRGPPADSIRDGSPEEAADPVGDGDRAVDGGGRRRRGARELAEDRDGVGDEEDPRGDVEEEHRPERPELGTAQRLRGGETRPRGWRGRDGRRGPGRGEGEAGGRVGHERRGGAAEEDEDQPRHAEDRHDDADRPWLERAAPRLHDRGGLGRDGRERRDRLEEVGEEEGAEAEAHHHEAAAEPAPARAPLGDRGHRRDGAEPEPQPADDAERGDQPRGAEPRRAEAGEQVPAPPEDRAGDRDGARAGAVLPAAADDRADAQGEERIQERLPAILELLAQLADADSVADGSQHLGLAGEERLVRGGARGDEQRVVLELLRVGAVAGGVGVRVGEPVEEATRVGTAPRVEVHAGPERRRVLRPRDPPGEPDGLGDPRAAKLHEDPVVGAERGRRDELTALWPAVDRFAGEVPPVLERHAGVAPDECSGGSPRAVHELGHAVPEGTKRICLSRLPWLGSKGGRRYVPSNGRDLNDGSLREDSTDGAPFAGGLASLRSRRSRHLKMPGSSHLGPQNLPASPHATRPSGSGATQGPTSNEAIDDAGASSQSRVNQMADPRPTPMPVRPSVAVTLLESAPMITSAAIPPSRPTMAPASRRRARSRDTSYFSPSNAPATIPASAETRIVPRTALKSPSVG